MLIGSTLSSVIRHIGGGGGIDMHPYCFRGDKA